MMSSKSGLKSQISKMLILSFTLRPSTFCAIFHLCPKAKIYSVMEVRYEKHCFKAKYIHFLHYILQIKLKITK